jgi:hypothetical protein
MGLEVLLGFRHNTFSSLLAYVWASSGYPKLGYN